MSATEDTRTSPRQLAKMIEDGFRAALEDFVPEEPAPEREEHADTLIYVNPPNAGQDATYTLAAEAPMLPLSIYCRLTTSNAVANRNVAVRCSEPQRGGRVQVGGRGAVSARRLPRHRPGQLDAGVLLLP